MQEFSLEELQDSLYLLSFLTSNETSRLHKEQQLSIEAGAYVSRLYDALAKQYHHIEEKDERAQEGSARSTCSSPESSSCFYAEDADLLQSHQAFGRYCEGDPAKLRRKLVDLFEASTRPWTKRDEYMDEDLAALHVRERRSVRRLLHHRPQMTPEILEAITDASQDFDWREISGVIFGGVFEDAEPRGPAMPGHALHVENIEALPQAALPRRAVGRAARGRGRGRRRNAKQALARLHDKVASITIGDPACSSGQLPYRGVPAVAHHREPRSSRTSSARPATRGRRPSSLRRTARPRISRSTVRHRDKRLRRLGRQDRPLDRRGADAPKDAGRYTSVMTSTSCRSGASATSMRGQRPQDRWSEVFPDDLTYLVGNPPFLGAHQPIRSRRQSSLRVFDGAKNAGNIDYCGAWYMKAARFSQGKRTRCALVSTNSICQGEQVANLWKPLPTWVSTSTSLTTRSVGITGCGQGARVLCHRRVLRESRDQDALLPAAPDGDEEQIPRLESMRI